jgi:hypothetical protein
MLVAVVIAALDVRICISGYADIQIYASRTLQRTSGRSRTPPISQTLVELDA